MTETPSRPYHHGDLKRALLDTAMQMLAEAGGWQFTLREVARRAGVSHSAPYKHFSDKGELLAGLALIGFDRLREELQRAQQALPGGIEAEFDAMAKAYLGFGQGNAALYRLMFGPEVTSATRLHTDPRALSTFEIVVELLERGQSAGIFRKRPVQGQAAACWAQMHGLTLLTLDGLLLPEKVGANAVEAALEALCEGLCC
ncbi:TetR/AcrR family transcriptional regulator [Ketogulonicigenium vulgare]|nr:TetR/AcrR family transcriptional regulator [Ketogulonicigenium vulgare]